MASLNGVSKWDDQADIVIVGFGLAGASAAIEALEADPQAKILLLEKAPEHLAGGNTRVSGQSLMIARDADALANYQIRMNHANPVPEELVHWWAKKMVELEPWIRARAEEAGAEMIRGAGFSDREAILEFPEYGAAEAVGHTATILPIPSGVWLAFKANIDKRPIRVEYETAMTDLVQDPDSLEVFGVVVEQGGDKRFIKAHRGVILTCGGYENNLQMQRDYCGVEDAYALGTPMNTGDGIRVLQKAGADMWHLRSKGQPGGLFAGIQVPMYETVYMRNFFLMNFNWIEVAKDGRRFGNETYPYQLTHWKTKVHEHYLDTLHSLVMPVRMIFDETFRANNCLIMPIMTWNAVVEDYEWSEDNSAEIEAGWIIKADTIQELAEKTGMDPATIMSTVEGYNDVCELGVDAEFGREPETLQKIATPPFYAVDIVPGIVCTSGGARRNTNSQVLGHEGKVIPGLYEAGELGSMFSYLYQNGSYLTEAMISGRAAGLHAANAKPSQQAGS